MLVGLDLIEIERVARALERPRFRERVYTEAERAYCDTKKNPAQSYAARFAGKEAVGKALGIGVHFTWQRDRDRGAAQAGRAPQRPHAAPGPSASASGASTSP